jgi:hypothetical protein
VELSRLGGPECDTYSLALCSGHKGITTTAWEEGVYSWLPENQNLKHSLKQYRECHEGNGMLRG